MTNLRCDTVAELANLLELETGDHVHVLGYYAANDGGGQVVRYDAAAADAIDDGFVFDGPGSVGRFIAVEQDEVKLLRFGCVGDDATDDTTALTNAFAAGSANLVHVTSPTRKVYQTTARITINSNTGVDLRGSFIKQADAAELATVVQISAGSGLDRNVTRLAVDGNRDNNTAAVTGIVCNSMSQAREGRFEAVNCDVGTRIEGNVESSRIKVDGVSCGWILEMRRDGGGDTPDECHVKVNGHTCDNGVSWGDQSQITGHLEMYVETISETSIEVLGTADVHLSGVLRGVCQNNNSTGIFINTDASGSPRVHFDGLHIMGDAAATGTTALVIEEALVIDGKIVLDNTIDGVWVKSITNRGSLQVQTTGALTGTAVILGDAAGTRLSPFVIEQGSQLQGGTGSVEFRNSNTCYVDGTAMLSGTVTFGAGSLEDTVIIPSDRANNAITVDGSAVRPNAVYRKPMRNADLGNIPTLFDGSIVENWVNGLNDRAGSLRWSTGDNCWLPPQDWFEVNNADVGATPSVKVSSGADADQQMVFTRMVLTNTAAQNVTTFADMAEGQRVQVRFSDGNTTLVHSDTANGLVLKSGANETVAAGTVKIFNWTNGRAIEIGA